MYSQDEFIEALDEMVSPEIQAALNIELQRYNSKSKEFGFLDFFNMQERGRVLTIKDRISSTHQWSRVTCADSKGIRTEAFWCERCGIKCSAFDYINALSIISKVNDRRPSYTVHNQYLMFSCEDIKNFAKDDDCHCFVCGMPDKIKTELCHTAEC